MLPLFHFSRKISMAHVISNFMNLPTMKIICGHYPHCKSASEWLSLRIIQCLCLSKLFVTYTPSFFLFSHPYHMIFVFLFARWLLYIQKLHLNLVRKKNNIKINNIKIKWEFESTKQLNLLSMLIIASTILLLLIPICQFCIRNLGWNSCIIQRISSQLLWSEFCHMHTIICMEM